MAADAPTGARVRFLAELEPDEAHDLRALGAPRRYARGDALFHQGDDAGGVLVIESGHLKVATVAAAGREIILSFPEPGDLVGELSAIDGSPRSGTARALDDVEALAIPGPAFRAFLERRPRVALVVLRLVIDLLRQADRQRIDYAVHDVVGRVARRLVELCDRFGTDSDAGVEIGLALTQEELASWTGSSREAVANAMRLLRTLGWIETHRRRIVVRDMPALRRYAT